MEIFVNVIDTEIIDAWRSQNLTKEDYNDVLDQQPEFLRETPIRSTWGTPEGKLNVESINSLEHFDDDEDYQEEIDRYNIELPFGCKEIELYDNQKSFDENFEKGSSKKYVLIEIDKNKKFSIANVASVIPDPQSKCIIDIEKVEDFSELQFIPIDYDTFFGLRLLSFEKYKSTFFVCDERVVFEAFLIKYHSFGLKAFYWSFNKIFEEVGIKKDRATKIIEKFIKLGIVSKKLIKTQIDKRPMQINYYDLNIDRIIELVPEIYQESDNIDIEANIREYLTRVAVKK